jgi:two-component system OmpR family sensor kinase
MSAPGAAPASRPARPAWGWVALPLLVSGAAAVVLAVVANDYQVYVSGPVAITTLLAGVLVAAAVATLQAVRTRQRTAAAQAWAAAHATAQADRQRLLMRLDHELKNPLTAIRAGLANLATAVPAAGPDRAALESVSAQAVRLSRMVADLRKLAELETRPIERYPVDLAEVLSEVADALGDVPEAEGRTVRLSLPRAPWPLPPVPGDRDLLFLAVLNLGLNAVKYSRPGDTVEIRAGEDGNAVEVQVADTGIGIPADEVGSVWEELSRGRAARGVPGTGLGLPLVRAVAARHGGTVSLRSREGHGTVVRLRVPL